MSWWSNVLKYAAPVVGAGLGSVGAGELGLSPTLGGAIGGGLGGFLGGEFGGLGTGGALLEGALGAGGGALAGDTLAGLVGAPGATTAAGVVGDAAHEGLGTGGASGLDSYFYNVGQGAATGAIPAAVSGAAPAVAQAAAAGAPGATLGASGGGLLGFLKNNPALAIGGLGVGAEMLTGAGNQNYPAETALQAQAKLLGKQGGSGASGQLTPAAKIALQDAVASIKSSYANMGLSGSTMEAQDIAAAKERAVAASVQQGLQELGMSSSLYSQILGYQMSTDQQMSDAITNLLGQIGYGAGTQASTHG